MKDFLKKFGDFWYYNRLRAFIILIVAIIITIIIVQVLSKTPSDYTVILDMNQNVSDKFISGFEKSLENYGGDLNGDGKIIVKIINCSYDRTGTDYQFQQSQQKKLASELMLKNTYLYIADESVYNSLDPKMFTEYSFLNTKNGKAFCSSNTRIEGMMKNEELNPPPLYFSIRSCDQTDKKACQSQKKASNMLKVIAINSSPD